MKPICYDLFCGLGGWADGFLAAGYRVVGYDIEAHDYGDGGYPAELRLQDVRQINGTDFADAICIVASPPCQEFSYMAMPWSRGKQIAAALRGKGEFPAGYTGSRTVEQLNDLFNQCFRIQREASAAAGRYIPLVVENVKGAERWVGPAKANYGSYFLWGDVGRVGNRIVAGDWQKPENALRQPSRSRKTPVGSWDLTRANYTGDHKWNPEGTQRSDGDKVPGFRFDGSGRSFQTASVNATGIKVAGHRNRRNGESHTRHLTNPQEHEGIKQGGDWFGRECQSSISRMCSSKSPARKRASAEIAKIPFALAQHIARVFARQ